MFHRQFLAAAVCCVLSIAAAASARAADTVTIFAAASLKNALDETCANWRSETGNSCAVSYAASSALAKQIEAGAPADIFISADRDWMKDLASKNLVAADSLVELLSNTLVLVAPANTTAAVKIENGFPLADLLAGGKLAMADVKAVPAGKYGKAALEALGVWPTVEASVAQAENVRAALKFVVLGEAPLGIVYGSDAAAEPGVKVLDTFPEDSHPPIVYPAAVTKASISPTAPAFMAYLKSPEASAVFKAAGFMPLAGKP